MKVPRVATVLIGSGTSSFMAHAQAGFFYKWENRVRSTLAEQPPWPVPLFAPSSNLPQLFRYDVVGQITHVRTDTWNYYFSKDFFLIPWYSTEVDINIPPYIQHNSSARDGFGDFGAVLKYRLSAGNQEHGNYSIAASLPITFPPAAIKTALTMPPSGRRCKPARDTTTSML